MFEINAMLASWVLLEFVPMHAMLPASMINSQIPIADLLNDFIMYCEHIISPLIIINIDNRLVIISFSA
jgi:hypothetical protein